MITEYILQFDEFLRSVAQNSNARYSFLLGAGASVESGIPSAQECIWDWKCKIFISNNSSLARTHSNFRNEKVRRNVQNWIDAQPRFPALNSEEEYSYYAEKAYPIEADRRKYFEDLIIGKRPSIGYHILMLLAQKEFVKSIWTTNFDGFSVKTAHQYDLVPIEITLESQARIYRTDVVKEILCIALHGDYKYGKLKNIANELDSQDDILVKALKHEVHNRNFIVMGYSGRDKSLMDAIKNVYAEPGAGRLYWCGYGNTIPVAVSNLLTEIREKGREAYYIPTDGFDTTMLMLAKNMYLSDIEFQKRINLLKGESVNEPNKKNVSFLNNGISVDRVVDSNLYPIAFPKSCFKFKINVPPEKTEWRYCKELLQYNIVAAPTEGEIYAWGNKDTIMRMCQKEVQGTIQICPLTREVYMRNGAIKYMLVTALTNILADSANKFCRRNRIYDIHKKVFFNVENLNIGAYEAVEVGVFFDHKYTYLCINPTYEFIERGVITKNQKREFARLYNEKICNGKPNLYFATKINEWKSLFFEKGNINVTYPLESGNEIPFSFTILNRSVYVGLESKNRVMFPSDFDWKRVVFKGREVKDSDLVFYDSLQKKLTYDFHPMRGLVNGGPYNNAYDLFSERKSVRIAGVVPEHYRTEFVRFVRNLHSIHNTRYNVDYVINYPGFYEAFKTGIEIPAESSEKWVDIEVRERGSLLETAISYADAINQKIANLYAYGNVDVVLIYIPERYEKYTKISSLNEIFDLHDYVKAFAVQKHIATQFIREKTIRDDKMRCQIMWALALAIYVKAGRTPWTLSNLRNDTAFVGIGYSVSESCKGRQTIIGCSHIYSSDGQGLKYKLSKINDVTFDEKKNPYLTEDEAFRLGLGIKELFFNSFSEMPKRVVVHKRTPFKAEEIKGLTKCLVNAGIAEVDLIEIAHEDNVKCFALNRQLNLDGFPIKRGTCFPYNDNSAFLYTHGVATSIRNVNYSYIQGGKSIPTPLKIVKHYGSGDMTQIISEILGLSKMNWNSFGLYTKMPCTIESSNQIARIGWLLSNYEGATYEFRHFM